MLRIGFLAILFLFFCVGFVDIAHALDTGLQETATASELPTDSGTLPQLIGNVVGTALSMVGILFLILTVFGGFLWMTARGKEDQTKKARDTIVAALIGFIIVLGAYALTTAVFTSLSGTGSAPRPSSPSANEQPDPNASSNPVENGDSEQIPAPPQEKWFACTCTWEEWQEDIFGNLEVPGACIDTNLEAQGRCVVGKAVEYEAGGCVAECDKAFPGEGGYLDALLHGCAAQSRTFGTDYDTRDEALNACPN